MMDQQKKNPRIMVSTAQKMKFSITGFLSKCDQICSFQSQRNKVGNGKQIQYSKPKDHVQIKTSLKFAFNA